MAKKAKKAPRKSEGKVSRLGICAWFAATFEANELLPAKKRLTDEQILLAGMKEFPNRPVWKSFDSGKLTINAYRQQYNKGDFTQGIPPAIPSFRYNKQGEAVEPRKGLRPLHKKEKEAIIEIQERKHDEAVDLKAGISPSRKKGGWDG